MKRFWKSVFKTEVTREQSKATVMALVLAFFLLTLVLKRDVLLFSAMVVHVLNMVAPQVYRPAAVI